MKGIVFFPPSECNSTERAKLIAQYLNFELRLADDCNPQQLKAEGMDVVINLGRPTNNNPYSMQGLVNLDKSIKVISYLGDLHSIDKKVFLPLMQRVLERSDKILCVYDERFKKLWPQYLYKYECMPHFISPYESYAQLPYNNKPIMKVLLSGTITEWWYPFRCFIRDLNHPYVERLICRGSYLYPAKTNLIGDDYIKELNKYFCSIATSTRFKRIVGKHFEIAAAGALLLADYVEGLKSIGFIENKHYIRIDKDNVSEVITDVIENPQKYEGIRREGRKYVLENHTIRNRIPQFKRIIREVCQLK